MLMMLVRYYLWGRLQGPWRWPCKSWQGWKWRSRQYKLEWQRKNTLTATGTWKPRRARHRINFTDQHVTMMNCRVVVKTAPTETKTLESKAIETRSIFIIMSYTHKKLNSLRIHVACWKATCLFNRYLLLNYNTLKYFAALLFSTVSKKQL